MDFLKHMGKFLTSKFTIILTTTLVAIFLVFRFFIDIQLVSTNVTWIYSSSMQTLAALIALLPISYGYYINNLESEKNEEIDSYIINRLKSDVYFDMMTVIIYSIIVIIINLLSFFINYGVYFALGIGMLTIEGIGLISLYIYRLFDPNKVKDAFKVFDNATTPVSLDKYISLDTFITKYLDLETAVKDFISNKNDNELVDKLPLYDIVDNMSKDFPEIQEYYNTFKEIIFHRNNVIHNYTETTVDFGKYTKILELIEVFDKLNNQFIQKNIFGNVIKIKNTIEICLKEYLLDMQNDQTEIGNLLDDLKEEVASLLHSYFISDYYITRSLDNAQDADFEVIQSNYSEKKLIGIDIKSISSKNLKSIASAYFKRLDQRFMYLFLINYDSAQNSFIVMYKTKDEEFRSIVVK
jgi:hypothetical protein